MTMQFALGLLLFILFAFFLYRTIRHGGFKAALFGASIEKTTGEIQGQPQLVARTAIKVHKLASVRRTNAVGLEFVTKGWGSYTLVPVTLSVDQTKELIVSLQAAIDE